MRYTKIYNQLISKRRKNPWNRNDGYCEYHHVIPVSIGGANDPRLGINNKRGSNLIGFTAREHYMAHLLLVKIMERKYGYMSKEHISMIRAVMYFKTSNKNLKGRKRIRFTSRMYQKIREKYSIAQSKEMMGKMVGSKNGMFGRKRTEEEKQKIRETRLKNSIGFGKSNSMYGKPCYYNMTDEEKESWKKNISETYKRKKFKHMYNPKSGDNRMIPLRETKKYLKTGYVFGQLESKPRNMKGRIRVHLENDRKKVKMIRKSEMKKYSKMGYVK